MKRKHLFFAVAALLAVGGLWLARSPWWSDDSAFQKSVAGADFKSPSDKPNPGEMLDEPNPVHTHAPPVPNRRFTEFTPEQRVEFARKGHGPGG